jgi:hypothetical protein
MSIADHSTIARAVSEVKEEMRKLNEQVTSDTPIGLDQTAALQQRIDRLSDLVSDEAGSGGTSPQEKYLTFAVGLYRGDARVWVEELMRDTTKEAAKRRLEEAYRTSAETVAFMRCIDEETIEERGDSTREATVSERNRKAAHEAVSRARRPGENPEDSVFAMVEREVRAAIEECEPGTEQAYASHVAAMFEQYAGNILQELESTTFEDQI